MSMKEFKILASGPRIKYVFASDVVAAIKDCGFKIDEILFVRKIEHTLKL